MTWSFPVANPVVNSPWRLGLDSDGPSIVLIEDDRAIADIYTLQLEVDGFRVRVASDGRTGLAKLRESPPQLVLLDLRLPQQDGFEVLKEIRSDPSLAGLQVVILSNYGDAAVIARGLEMGARDYLVKSQTTPALLSARVREWLGPRSRSD